MSSGEEAPLPEAPLCEGAPASVPSPDSEVENSRQSNNALDGTSPAGLSGAETANESAEGSETVGANDSSPQDDLLGQFPLPESRLPPLVKDVAQVSTSVTEVTSGDVSELHVSMPKDPNEAKDAGSSSLNSGKRLIGDLLSRKGIAEEVVSKILEDGESALSSGEITEKVAAAGVNPATLRALLPKVTKSLGTPKGADVSGNVSMGDLNSADAVGRVSRIGDDLSKAGLRPRTVKRILTMGQKAIRGDVARELMKLKVDANVVRLGLVSSGGSQLPIGVGELLMERGVPWDTATQVMTDGVDALDDEVVRRELEDVGLDGETIRALAEVVDIDEDELLEDGAGEAKKNAQAHVAKLNKLLKNSAVDPMVISRILSDGQRSLHNRVVLKELSLKGVDLNVVRAGLMARNHYGLSQVSKLLGEAGVPPSVSVQVLKDGALALTKPKIASQLKDVDVEELQDMLDGIPRGSLDVSAKVEKVMKGRFKKYSGEVAEWWDEWEDTFQSWGKTAMIALGLRSDSREGVKEVHVVSKYGMRYELATVLSERPSAPLECDSDNRTALHYACEGTSIYIVRRLLEAGARINHQDVEGWTPLHVAVFKRNVPMVLELIKQGCDTEITNYAGETALELCVKGKRKRCLAVLVETGADIPMHIAADVKRMWTEANGSFGSAGISSGTNAGDGDTPDELGTEVYADALGTLVSHTSTTLPISVGMYGQPGSGKSFVIHKMHRVVEALNRIEQVQGYIQMYGIRACERCIQPDPQRRKRCARDDPPPETTILNVILNGIEKGHHRIAMKLQSFSVAPRVICALLLAPLMVTLWAISVVMEMVAVNEERRAELRLKSLHLKVLYAAWNRRLFKSKLELRRNEKIMCRCQLFCAGGKAVPIESYISHQRHAYRLGKKGAKNLPALPEVHKAIVERLRYAWVFRLFRCTCLATLIVRVLTTVDLVHRPAMKLVTTVMYGVLGPFLFVILWVKDIVFNKVIRAAWLQTARRLFGIVFPLFRPPVPSFKPRKYKAISFNPSLYKDPSKVWAALLAQIYRGAEDSLGNDTIRAERLRKELRFDKKLLMWIIWPLALPIVFLLLALLLWRLITSGTFENLGNADFTSGIGSLGAIGAVLVSLVGVGGLVLATMFRVLKGAKKVLATPSGSLAVAASKRAVSERVGFIEEVNSELDFFSGVAEKHNLIFWVIIDNMEKADGGVALETLGAVQRMLTDRRGKPFVVVVVTDPLAVERRIGDYVKRVHGDTVANSLFLEPALQIHLNMRRPNDQATREFLLRMLPKPSAASEAKTRKEAVRDIEEERYADDSLGHGSGLGRGLGMTSRRGSRDGALDRRRLSRPGPGLMAVLQSPRSTAPGEKTSKPANQNISDGISHFSREEKSYFSSISMYLIPNPRRVRLIFNTYWIVRAVESSLVGENERRKLIAMSILANQWPYRLSWIMQYISDSVQTRPDLKEVEAFVSTPLSTVFDAIRHIIFPPELGLMSSLDSDPDLFEAFIENHELFDVKIGDLAFGTFLPHNLDVRVTRAVEDYSSKIHEYPTWAVAERDSVERALQVSLREMTGHSHGPESAEALLSLASEYAAKLRARMIFTAHDLRAGLLDPKVLPELRHTLPAMLLYNIERSLLGSMKRDVGNKGADHPIKGTPGPSPGEAASRLVSSAEPTETQPAPEGALLCADEMSIADFVQLAFDEMKRKDDGMLGNIVEKLGSEWITTVGELRAADANLRDSVLGDFPGMLRQKLTTLLAGKAQIVE